jgi:hypothetical protein
MAKERRRASAVRKKVAGYYEAAIDSKETTKSRVAAMRHATTKITESKAAFQAVLKVLIDVEEPVEIRTAALNSLQASAFRVADFEPYRRDYVAALRSLGGDKEPEIRKLALGILAREQDRPTQKKLLAGLEDPEKAMLPPEKALQYLAYDVHTDAYPVAKRIVKDPPSEAAKREALRLLAGDTSAMSMFQKLLRDKTESSDIRQICASALQGAMPKKYQEHAREMALDETEDDDVRAQSLNALTHFGDAAALAKDTSLRKVVEKAKEAAPASVKKLARLFLKKYGD